MFGRNQGRTLKTSRASSTQRARTACFVPTSDRNAEKVSEVRDFRGVPPTETREKCRRSGTFKGYLRQKCGKSVGGPGLSRGTSDRNAGKVSEVQDFRGVPPTETREKCRRSSSAEVHKGSQQPGIPNLRPPELTKAKY